MIKKLFCTALLVSLVVVGRAQRLPDLTQQARLSVLTAKDDTSKIDALARLGNLHIYYFIHYKQQGNRDSTFLAYKDAMKIADGLKSPDKGFWQMVVLAGIGESECYVGDTLSGRKKLMRAMTYFKTHQHISEELHSWRILGKTAEYYGDRAGQLAYLRVLERLSLKYQRIDMMIRAKERIIELTASLTKPDTVKPLYLGLIKDYGHTNAPSLDEAFAQLARYHRYKGDLPAALSYALSAHAWMVKTNDTADTKKSTFYGELAEVYQLLGQSEKSIEWYKKTIAARRHMGMVQVSIYRTAGFLVQEYIKLKKAREALAYITKLSHEFPPLGLDNQASLWQMKAYCYEALGQFALAETAYLNMIRGYYQVKVENEILHLAKYDIGKFYVQRDQFDKAAQYINENEMRGWSVIEVKDLHYMLFKIDSAHGRYISAIKHFNAYKNISDSVFNTVKSKQISELEIKYATEQKENDIRALTQAQHIQDERIRNAERIRNWVIIGLALLSAVLILLYRSFRSNRIKSKEIDRKNASLSRLVAEKDDLLQEKEWLMKEIHHRVKNNLQIVMGLLQRQSSFIDNEEALAAIRNSEQRMQSIALIHQKLYQSDSFMLVSMGAYIDEMVGYLRECFDLGERIIFEKKVETLDFEVNMAVSLGLILNEAITNAIKYAFPNCSSGQVRITLLKLAEHSFLLEIDDNGVGLSSDIDPAKLNSMGFNLMRGLSKQLGGKLTVRNENGLVISVAFQTD